MQVIERRYSNHKYGSVRGFNKPSLSEFQPPATTFSAFNKASPFDYVGFPRENGYVAVYIDYRGIQSGFRRRVEKNSIVDSLNEYSFDPQ